MTTVTSRRISPQAAAAVGVWIVFALAIAGYIVLDGRRTVTPTYRIAGQAWFAGRTLYNNASDIGGFLYFPQAALVYMPFAALPFGVGEVVWRLCGLALIAGGLSRLARLIDFDRHGSHFLLLTLLCLPATVSSARNGQMNLHLAGLMLHASADVAVGVWWRAALSLTLGLALKPHAVVLLVLIAAAYPRTRGWLVAMIIAAAAMPFLFQSPGYVVDQYQTCLRRVVFASMPATDTWSDLRGLLIRLNVHVSNGRLIFLRLAAAVPTLMLVLVARRHGKAWAAIYTFALASTYLMIFNPRTEANTYVILAPAVAALAALALTRRRGDAFWALVAFAVTLGCENYGRTIFSATDLWLKPLLTIAFGGYLVRLVLTVPIGVLRGVDA